MGLLTFKGGIHPDDGKRFSKDQPIKALLPTGDLIYPLSQHIGAPAVPVVKKGDQVLKGQMIAEAGGFVSAPVYSSVSGKVKALEKHFNPTGTKVDCIVIQNDGEYQDPRGDHFQNRRCRYCRNGRCRFSYQSQALPERC